MNGTMFYSLYKAEQEEDLCFIREDFQLINCEFLQC